jgi:uncharacterized membrane protein
MDNGEGLGARFWLSVMGIALACGVGAVLVFVLIGAAWARWGLLGAIIFFGVILLGTAWIYDRRHAKSYDETAI